MPTGGGQTCWVSCSADLLGREFSREVFGTLPLKLEGNETASQVSTWICPSRSLSRGLGGWVGRGAGLDTPHPGKPCLSSLLVNGVSTSTPRCWWVWAIGSPSPGLMSQSIKREVGLHHLKTGIAQPLQPSSCSDARSWGLQVTLFSPLSTWAVGVHTGNLWGVKWRAKCWHQIRHRLRSSVVTGFPCVSSVSSAYSPGRQTPLFLLLDGKVWEWLPTPAFLPGGFHEQRSLAGYSPWGHKKLDTTEQFSFT